MILGRREEIHMVDGTMNKCTDPSLYELCFRLSQLNSWLGLFLGLFWTCGDMMALFLIPALVAINSNLSRANEMWHGDGRKQQFVYRLPEICPKQFAKLSRVSFHLIMSLSHADVYFSAIVICGKWFVASVCLFKSASWNQTLAELIGFILLTWNNNKQTEQMRWHNPVG